MIIERRRGGRVRSTIVVTHAMIKPIHMSTAQMLQAVKMGAYIEFVYNALIGPNKEFTFGEYASAIRAVGAAHSILSSDLGQVAQSAASRRTGGVTSQGCGRRGYRRRISI